MIGDYIIMNNAKNLIAVSELKRLLFAISDNHLNVCFRYRLIGEMWKPNFFKVIKVTDESILLNDEQKNELMSLSDLSLIMQFEIDAPVHHYIPHNHYELDPVESM